MTEQKKGTARPRGRGKSYYASPEGKTSGDGSRERPWELCGALGNPAIKPGDTLWLTGGIYYGEFVCELAGAPDKPVYIRACPGERVIIDGYMRYPLIVRGDYVWLRDIEIMNGNPMRLVDQEFTFRRGATTVFGKGVKFINMVLHDESVGVGAWHDAPDWECYGCLVYYNGTIGVFHVYGDRSLGMSLQNLTEGKLISDNIIFCNTSHGIMAYGTAKAAVRDVKFIGNVVFNSGLPRGQGQEARNLMISGAGTARERILVANNVFYHELRARAAGNLLGDRGDAPGKDITVSDSYFIGGDTALEMHNWGRIAFIGNTLYSTGRAMALGHRPDQSPTEYRFERNRYYAGKLIYNDKSVDFAGWRRAAGLDQDGGYSKEPPKGLEVMVRPNKYEKGRGNICVLNWDKRETVDVDVSGVGLKRGDAYEARDVQNFFGAPVAAGVYDGRPIGVKMTSRAMTLPVGNLPIPAHTGPEFGVFVIRKTVAP